MCHFIVYIAESDYDIETDKIEWTIEEREHEDDADHKVVFDTFFYIPISILFSLLILCYICANSFHIANIIVCVILFVIKELILFSR